MQANTPLAPFTGEGFSVEYLNEEARLWFRGMIRLGMNEYGPLQALLQQVADQEPPLIILDVRQLEALNSSGITLLARFISDLNKRQTSQLTLYCSPTTAWQQKSFRNFQRLMPGMQITTQAEEAVLEIQTEEYRARYQPSNGELVIEGMIRLRGEAFGPLSRLLRQVEQESPPLLRLDIRHLRTLNSSGITLLARFMLNLHRASRTQAILLGSRQISWQGKSIANFQRLMPDLRLVWEPAEMPAEGPAN